MANFDPPDHHWAADFDARLMSAFTYLKDKVDELERRALEVEKKDSERDAALAQAVADVRFYRRGSK